MTKKTIGQDTEVSVGLGSIKSSGFSIKMTKKKYSIPVRNSFDKSRDNCK